MIIYTLQEVIVGFFITFIVCGLIFLSYIGCLYFKTWIKDEFK